MTNTADIMESFRTEFERILQGPGVTWNKQGMLNVFDKAMAKALAKALYAQGDRMP